MAGPDTLALIVSARNGDRSAWAELASRYYDDWLRKFHGQLDRSLRKLYDTQDLVQSAVADAMRDISALDNEAAFFVWVNAIIRHKIATRRRRLCRERALSESAHDRERGNSAAPDVRAESLDDYLACLEAILDLFPKHPEPIAAVAMKLIEGLAVKDIAARFQRPERTVYRWLEDGLGLLKERFGVMTGRPENEFEDELLGLLGDDLAFARRLRAVRDCQEWLEDEESSDVDGGPPVRDPGRMGSPKDTRPGQAPSRAKTSSGTTRSSASSVRGGWAWCTRRGIRP